MVKSHGIRRLFLTNFLLFFTVISFEIEFMNLTKNKYKLVLSETPKLGHGMKITTMKSINI